MPNIRKHFDILTVRERMEANPFLTYEEARRAYSRDHNRHYRSRPEIKRKNYEYNINYRKAHSEIYKYSYRRFTLWKYKLTPEQYQDLLQKQKGVCALCGVKPKRTLHVDHDHKTGKVRGLLCLKCNTSIARADDFPGWLLRAEQYLQGELI